MSNTIIPKGYTIENHVFDNGFKVVYIQCPTASRVRVQMYIGSGSSDDPDNKSGLAHLAEHMVYRSNSNFTKDELTTLTTDKDIGFFSYTTYDCTVHNLGCAQSELSFTIYLLFSALCKQLCLDHEFVVAQRNLCDEIKSVTSNPFNRAYFKLLHTLSKSSHVPCLYRNPCGAIDQVNNITPADITEWFNNHYVASNMILTIVGNFDINTIHKQVETSYAQYVRAGVKTPAVHSDVVFDKDIDAECASGEETRLMLGWNIGKSDLNYKLLAADEIVERILFNGEDSELRNLLDDSDCIDVGGHICRTFDDGWIAIGGGLHGSTCVDKLHTSMNKFAESLASFDVYNKSFSDRVRKAKQALIEQTRDKLSDIDEVIEYLPKLYSMGITNMSSMNDMCDVTPSDVAEVIKLMQQPHVMSKVVAV